MTRHSVTCFVLLAGGGFSNGSTGVTNMTRPPWPRTSGAANTSDGLGSGQLAGGEQQEQGAAEIPIPPGVLAALLLARVGLADADQG